jgi:hypothetical protein
MSQRRIAPLLVRPRSSSFQPERSSKSPNAHRLSPESSMESSHRRHSYQHQDATTNVHHLTLPSSNSLPAPFQFGQTGSKSQPDEQDNPFTFRALHNVTPRPSPEPEVVLAASSQVPPTKPNSSSWQILSKAEQELPQPLHAFYSDEKVAIDSVHVLSEPVQPPNISLSPKLGAGVGVTSPPQPLPSLSFTRPSELRTSPSPHSRRVSGISAVSDENDTLFFYDVREENTPLEPFFNPVFQTALQHGLEIAKSTATAIERVGDSSKFHGDLKGLLQNSKDLSTFQSSDTRTIAVLGDSGEGKNKSYR